MVFSFSFFYAAPVWSMYEKSIFLSQKTLLKCGLTAGVTSYPLLSKRLEYNFSISEVPWVLVHD